MGTIAAPGYATQVDVFFNDNPVDVIEIGAVDSYNPLYPTANYTFYIVWDELNTVDQQRLLDLIDEYGGTIPFGAAVDGFQVVDYQGNVVGGSATGLDDTAAVAGSHTYLYRTSKAGGDATNLPTENDDGVNERTRVILDELPDAGEYFGLSDTTTDYYVWYNTPAVAEVNELSFASIPANDTHFFVSDPAVNHYVWFFNEGEREVVDFDFSTQNIVGGDHFTLAMSGSDYYVWYNHAIAEVVDLDFSGGAGAALTEGSHLTFSDDTSDFYIWFDRPALPNIFVLDTAGILVAAQDETDYDGVAGNGTFVDGAGYAASDTITLIDASVITVDAVDSEGRVTGFTVTSAGGTVTPGVALTQASTSGAGASFQLIPGISNTEGLHGMSAVAGSHFVCSDSATDFYVWFTVDGAGVDPTPGGTGIVVDIESTDTAANVSEKIEAALIGSGAFDVQDGQQTTIRVTAKLAGAELTPAADVDAGLLVSPVQFGRDAGTDPAPGGTGIRVLLEDGNTDEDAATATLLAVNASTVNATFGLVLGDVVGMEMNVPGNVTDAADVDSGVNVIISQGAAGSTDPAPGGTGIQVNIDGDETSGQLAQLSETALVAGLGVDASSVELTTSTNIRVISESVGDQTDAADVDSGVSVTVVQQGSTNISTDPAPGGRSSIGPVQFVGGAIGGTSLEDVVAEVANVIDTVGAFTATNETDTVTVTSTPGTVLPASDVDAGVAVVQITAGLDAAVDPAPGGTGISVAYNPNDGKSLAQLAADTKAAMDGTLAGLVSTVRTGNTLTATVDLQGPANAAPTTGTAPFNISILAAGAVATPRTFAATVYVDGVANPISILGSAAATFGALITELDSDLTDATSAIDGNGNVTITADNVGESIFIVDGDLFKNTADQLRLDTPVTSEAKSYGMTIEVDGVAQDVVIAGENADTFTNLVAELTAEIAGADAAIDGDNNIVIQSDAVGNAGSIKIIRDGIFPNTIGFVGYGIPRHGATEFVDMMYLGEDEGGDTHFFKYAVRGIGAKPPVGNTNNTSTAVYYNGSAWVRLVDDTPI